MKFALLGLGGWLSNPYLDTISIVVDVNGKKILIDCGESIVKRLRKIGLSIEDIDFIIVTHSHGDHCLGFPSILLLASHVGKKLNVIALRETIQDLIEIVKHTHIDRHLSNINFIEISIDKDGKSKIEFQDFSLEFTYADHTIPSIALKVVDKDGRSIAYSGDTRPSENLIKFFSNTDILIYEVSCLDERCHEHGHSTVLDSMDIAERAGVKVLIPVHYYITSDIIYHRTPVPLLVPIPYQWYDVNFILERSYRYFSI